MKMILALFTKNNNYFYFLLLALSIFLYSSYNLNADEGVILSGAWHLYLGKELYFDFFEKIAPGSFYLIYWGFKVFGISYYTAQIISTLMVFFSAVFVHKIIKDLNFKNYPQGLNLLPSLLFIFSFAIFPIINHNLHSTFFAIISCFFFLRGLDSLNKKSSWALFLSGFFVGITAIFLQHKGLMLWGSSGLFLLINWFYFKKKDYFYKIIFYSAGFLIPVFLVLTKWPAKLLFNNLILSPFDGYLEVNKVPLTLLIVFLLILLCFIFYLRKENLKIKYLLFIQFFLLMSAIPLPDVYHIILISFPLLILSPLLFIKDKNYYKKNIVILLWSIFLIINVINISNMGVFYNEKKGLNLIKVFNETCQGEYLYAGPFSPGFYFEFQKMNATSFSVLLEGEYREEVFEKALEEIIKNKPNCVILHYYRNITEKFNHGGNNLIENYIRENYELYFQEKNFYLYKEIN